MAKTQGSHENKVIQYYADHTEKFYIDQWDKDDIHFGLFDEGESIYLYHLIPQHEEVKKRGIVRMTMETIAPAQIKKTDTVVDAGCGIGGTAMLIAQTYGCPVVGVNISQHQIDIATQKVKNANLSHLIQFQYGNCSQHLPFSDHSVDVIVNIESACQYSNRPQFLAECARILKPGGRIATQDWVAMDGVSPENYEKYITPLCNAWHIQSMETPKSYHSLLEDSGFDVVELVNLNCGVKPNFDYMHQATQNIDARQTPLTPDEESWYRHLDSISKAYFNGHFAVIRYMARLRS